MNGHVYFEIAAILVLVLANGFFALSEFSVIASRRSRLKQRIIEGKRGAVAAAKLREQPDRFLATIQVGITLFGTIAGVFGGATIVNPLHQLLEKVPIDAVQHAARPAAVVIVAFAITVTAVILGELVPKYLALSNPERFARFVAPPIALFIRLTWFFSAILSSISNAILRLFGIHRLKGDPGVTEDEINLMILEGKQRGVFNETEEQLIKSVFDFADSTVRRAMTPRTDVTALPVTAEAGEIIDTVIREGYSKYPVYDGNIDQIVGILYTRDLIHHKLNPAMIILKDLMRKPTFVPDSMPLSTLLRDFQRKKNQFAVVLDDYGGTAGIVTLEDILEELVGEIQDENDREEPPLVRHSDTIAYADGSVWPGAVNELMKTRLPEDRAETLAGLVIDHLGRLPSKDDTVTIADMKITILSLVENRLTRLKLERIERQTV